MTSKQRAFLRSLANSLQAKYQFGKNDIDENFLKTIDDALEANELIKISVNLNSMLTARELCDGLCEALDAEPVQVIGSKLVLYRESKKKKNNKIELPK